MPQKAYHSHMRAVLWLLLGSILALPAPAQAKDDHEPPPIGSRAETTHFVARCHFEDDALARATADAAEAAWPPTLQLLQRDAPELEARLPVHVYASVTDFVAAEQALTQGAFRVNRFFSHWKSRATHATLLPDCDKTVREALGARPHFFRQVAHEASHLTVFATIPNHESHPDWLAEGMATWVAEQISRERGWSQEGHDTPFYSDRMTHCQALRAKGTLPEPRAILQDHIGHLTHDEQYAVWWAFFRFLKEGHSQQIERIIDTATRMAGGAKFTKRLYAKIGAIWDRDGLDALNAAFRKYVDAFTPVWDEAYRCLETHGDTWTQVGFSDNNAMAWRAAPRGVRYAISGKVTIAPARNPQANVLLAKTDEGFFSVALRAGVGVTLLQFRRGAWTNHQFVEQDLQAGTPVAFEIRVEKDRIAVTSNGVKTIEKTLPFSLGGRWGVGVQAAAGAVWQGVRMKEKQ